ncbi:MAG: hypothetical protein HY302_16900 [Opitutae bacterium]|nr:hypothetical protein [Opitutae bacterium]
MNALLALWLPILLSAAVVFALSSLVHLVFKWHNSDYRSLANEDAVREVIRAGSPAPGQYVLPYCGDMKEMGSEAMLKKYRDGPVGFLTLRTNGPVNMGRSLGQWFVLCLVVATMAAFLASQLISPMHARAAGKLAGAVTFIAYGIGGISESIWMGRPWSSTAKHIFDAALYAVGSGLVFSFCWH